MDIIRCGQHFYRQGLPTFESQRLTRPDMALGPKTRPAAPSQTMIFSKLLRPRHDLLHDRCVGGRLGIALRTTLQTCARLSPPKPSTQVCRRPCLDPAFPAEDFLYQPCHGHASFFTCSAEHSHMHRHRGHATSVAAKSSRLHLDLLNDLQPISLES